MTTLNAPVTEENVHGMDCAAAKRRRLDSYDRDISLDRVPLYWLTNDLSNFITRAMQVFLETNRHKLLELGHPQVNDGLNTFIYCQKLFVEHAVAAYIEQIIPSLQQPGVDELLVLNIAQAAYEKNLKDILRDILAYIEPPAPNMVAVPPSATSPTRPRVDSTDCPIVKPVPRPAPAMDDTIMSA